MKTKKLTYVCLAIILLTGCNKDDETDTISREAFPDLLFEKYILQNFDSDGDGLISISEAKNVKEIDCSDMRITSLKGIQYFTELTSLNCSKNELKDFDLSKNTAIKVINCNYCDFGESIDFSKNTALETLSCSYNHNLTSLDFSKNTNLRELYCEENHNLSSLNLSNNNQLEILLCNNNNNIKSLDLSNNTNLKELTCIGSQLTLTGLEKYKALEKLNLSFVKVENIDIKGCPLTTFDCKIGNFSRIDLSGCDKLEKLKIEQINYNEIIEKSILNLDGCTSLKTIDISSYSVHSLNISSCTALQKLTYNGEVDISKNIALEEVYVGNITNDIKNNSKLRILHCGLIKDVETIDLSNQTQLEELSCSIAEAPINLNTCKTLKTCRLTDYFFEGDDVSNYIDHIEIKELPLLETFSMGTNRNNINFNIESCPMLKTFSTDGAAVLNVSNCASLEYLSGYKISTLNINQCENLIVLQCTNSPISVLQVDIFPKLQELYCENCQLKELDLRKNKALKILQCQGNKELEFIYVSHNIPGKNIGDATLVYSEE